MQDLLASDFENHRGESRVEAGKQSEVYAITVVLKQDTQDLVYSESRIDRWDGSVKQSR